MKNRITASFIGKFRWVSEDKFVNPEDFLRYCPEKKTQ